MTHKKQSSICRLFFKKFVFIVLYEVDFNLTIFPLFLIAIINRNNAIGPVGAQALAMALTGNSTMTNLDFSCVMKDI